MLGIVLPCCFIVFVSKVWRVFGVLAALYCFLFGLDLMGVSFKAGFAVHACAWNLVLAWNRNGSALSSCRPWEAKALGNCSRSLRTLSQACASSLLSGAEKIDV